MHQQKARRFLKSLSHQQEQEQKSFSHQQEQNSDNFSGENNVHHLSSGAYANDGSPALVEEGIQSDSVATAPYIADGFCVNESSLTFFSNGNVSFSQTLLTCLQNIPDPLLFYK